MDTQNSGRYDISVISGGGTYSNIGSFAAAARAGTLPAPSSGLYPNPDPHPQPWDFAIERSCYIVFVLTQGTSPSWQFTSRTPGVDFKEDQTGWYADLHFVADGSGRNTVAYFSGYVDPQQQWGPDPFTLYFDYWFGINYYPEQFDPAIKNKGHNHFLGKTVLRFPTPFKPPQFSLKPSAMTRKRLAAGFREARRDPKQQS